MKLNCRKCAAEIPAKNVNIQQMVANCPQCDHLFDFSDEIGRLDRGKKPSTPKPTGITVLDDGLQMQFQWRWFHWSAIPLALFALFWNGIMFSGFGSGVFFAFQSGHFWSAFGMLLIPHFWVGIGMGYYVLTMFFNTTKVTVDSDQMVVRHGPLPWWGNKTVERDVTVQLYSKKNDSYFRNRNAWSQGQFELHAVHGKGSQVKILSGLPSSEHPLFVESTVESYWGIEDYPVRGEIAR